jgi:hypothetical protein
MAIYELHTNEYENVCIELRELLMKEKELKAQILELKKQAIIMSGGNRMEYGIKISQKIRKGSVDVDRMSLVLGISQTMVESFRKPDTEYFEVRSY